MKVLGFRVYLDLPAVPETKTVLHGKAKEEYEKEMYLKYTKLKVFAVGHLCKDVKVGDVVQVENHVLAKHSIIEVEGDEKMVISEHDISHIW